MKIKQSLAFQLLKVTFSIYLIVTLSVTAAHMYTEWLQFEKYLKKDLYELGLSAKKGFVLAMWDLDYKQVNVIAEGLLALPIVTGVEIQDKQIKKMHGLHGDIVNAYQLIHDEDGLSFPVGNMKIYSSTGIVYKRIKHVYLLTILNAIAKTISLWLIVLWVGKKLISKPLTSLATHSHLISLDQLTDKNGVPLQISIKTKGQNEIKILEQAFNEMLLKLLANRNDIQAFNQTLELNVQERTLQLSKKNEELQQALEEVRTLRGILPICSFCKKIRNDDGYYEQIESYIHKHSEVDFSHTVCPACLKEHYPDFL